MSNIAVVPRFQKPGAVTSDLDSVSSTTSPGCPINLDASLTVLSLFPSAITYEPKINSRTVQGERTRAGARQEGGEADGGTETVGEAQGNKERTVNEASRSIGIPCN